MRRRPRVWRAGVLIAVAPALLAPAQAMESRLPNYTNLVQVPVRSLLDLRFQDVVRQSQDLSCGAAALATVLQHYYGQPVTEEEVIEAAFQVGDAELITRQGFSMLELKRVGELRGFLAQGFRIPAAESLRNLQVPAITLLTTRGYEHFVVIKAVEGNRVYIADPAFGNRAETLDQFAEGWGHVILVLLSPDQPGRSAFRSDPTVKAPMAQVIPLLDRPRLTILKGPGEF